MARRIAVKNRVRSLLGRLLVRAPYQDLFGPRGRKWLAAVELPADPRAVLDLDLRLLDAMEREIELLDGRLKASAHRDERTRLLVTLPGVDYAMAVAFVAALGDVGRFRDGDHVAGDFGLVPTTRQSGDKCYHGPITKAGGSVARAMLIQAAQHLPRTPGPLGAFFRRLARREAHGVAVVAAARKLAEIAFLMLKNGEPYRYASPLAARAKLSRLRVAATGERWAAKPALGKGRPPRYGSKVHGVNRPGLPQVYAAEGLPSIRTVDESPAGEQAMLRLERLTDAVGKLQRPHQRIRKDGHLLPEGGTPTR